MASLGEKDARRPSRLCKQGCYVRSSVHIGSQGRNAMNGIWALSANLAPVRRHLERGSDGVSSVGRIFLWTEVALEAQDWAMRPSKGRPESG